MIFKTVDKYKSWLCICICFISGCVYPLPAYIDNPAQDKSELFVIGKTTKDEVRDLLGSPFIVEEDLSVEVFRVSGTMGYLRMFFIYPYWYESEATSCWAIVKYKDDLVDEFDTGTFGNLKTKDFIFDYGTGTLLVSWDYYRKKMMRDNNEYEVDKSDCNVYISATNIGSIFLDSNYLGYGFTEDGFFYGEIKTGEHLLQFCYDASITVPNASQCDEPIEFKCIENQPVYFKAYTSNTNIWRRLKKEKEAIIIERGLENPEWITRDKIIVRQGNYSTILEKRIEKEPK